MVSIVTLYNRIRQVVRLGIDVVRLRQVIGTEEELEFLFEMVEPELHESKATLEHHRQEELVDVEDIEAFTNNMGRQGRRLVFIQALYDALREGLRQ